MKPIRQQFKEAFGYKGKTLAWYRDFALTLTAGLAIFVRRYFWVECQFHEFSI
jgi:hypothetical protein